MITKGGAKLLDFGLAKYAPGSTSSPSAEVLQSLATEHQPLTQEGTILGTFQGRNKTSVIGAIVSGEPRPVSALQPLTPPALEHVIPKCLAKEPDDRWQSAHDIAEEIRWIGSTSESSMPVAVRRKRARFVVPLIALASAIAGATAMGLVFRDGTPRSPRVALALSTPSIRGAITNPNIAISADRQWIAATIRVGSRDQLCLRQIERFDFVPIAGTEEASAPFFSPDGQWIGFFVPGALKKVSVTRGAPQSLAAARFGRGASWSRDGMIYYPPYPGSGIWKVPASGGVPRKVSEPDVSRGENSHRWPQMLPDGNHLLITVRRDRITSFDEAQSACARGS